MEKNRFNILLYFLTGMNAQHSSRELLAIPDITFLGGGEKIEVVHFFKIKFFLWMNNPEKEGNSIYFPLSTAKKDENKEKA